MEVSTPTTDTSLIGTLEAKVQVGELSDVKVQFLVCCFAIVTITKQQTKNCTFTSLSSPTCTFASNVPINDVSVVGVETSINTNTITSVTDSASNTYNLVTSFAVLSAVGLNAVYCSNVGSAGTLVVTVNFDAVLSVRIERMERDIGDVRHRGRDDRDLAVDMHDEQFGPATDLDP